MVSDYDIELLEVREIIPSEMVDDNHVRIIIQSIENTRIWTHPIPIDTQTHIVMDGNHRLMAAREIGLKYVPVFSLDYNSQNVKVFHNDQTQKLYDINSLLDIAKTREPLPFKSTKHIFLPILPTCSIDIKELR